MSYIIGQLIGLFAAGILVAISYSLWKYRKSARITAVSYRPGTVVCRGFLFSPGFPGSLTSRPGFDSIFLQSLL